MTKDPAFLFYYQDFAYGTRKMTFEEKGCYIELLCEQADSGHLSLDDIRRILRNSFPIWDSICSKFIQDSEGKYYNEVLESHIEKRKKFTESRKRNLNKSHMDSHMESHMVNVNVNTNVNENVIEEKGVQGGGVETVVNSWNAFAEMKGLTKIVKLTDKRKSNIKQRLSEKDFDLDHIFQRIDESDFLKGKNKHGWKVDFDFIFGSKNNWVKILEGKYGTNSTDSGASPDFLRQLVERRASREAGN